MKQTIRRKTESAKRILTIVLLVVLLTLCLCVDVFAVLFSANVGIGGNGSLGTVETVIDGASSATGFEMDCGSATLEFTEPGEIFDFSLTITNNSSSCFEYYYSISLVSASGLENAIFVYFNEEFLGTLASLCGSSENLLSDGYHKFTSTKFVLPAGQSATRVGETLSFELHNATAESYYFEKTCQVSVCSYAQIANVQNVAVVSSEQEFAYAIADVNYSTSSNEKTILLANDITLTQNYEIEKPCTIDLCGNELVLSSGNLSFEQSGVARLTSSQTARALSLQSGSGSIVLNDENAILIIDDFENANGDNVGKLYSAKVNVENCLFNTSAVESLLKKKLSSVLDNGVAQNSTVDLFGAMYFYTLAGISVDVENDYTYASGRIITPIVSETQITSITIESETIEFKILAQNDENIQEILEYLKHIPNSTEQENLIDLTYDLFLPKSIPSKNARIEWFTSDESLITTTGKIGLALGEATLTAVITVDGQTHVETFRFRVYGQDSQTKFAYFLTLLNPLTIEEVYPNDGSEIHLPIVDENDEHDYRNAYTLSKIDSSIYFSWSGCEDIGLQNVEYSVSPVYEYVTLENDNLFYLNQATFYTYAQINVRALFEGEVEYHEGVINVVIELGANTELQNMIFSYVEGEINKIDVLQNIINTRIELGMLNEKGDFTLPDSYENYEIEYAIPTSSTNEIITSITHDVQNGCYAFEINAEKFAINSSDVSLLVTIRVPGIQMSEDSRIMTFSVPGAVHCDTDGFAIRAVFESVKYQVWQHLPAEEKANESGFSLNGFEFLANTKDYILQRDIDLCSTLVFAMHDSVDDVSALYSWATKIGNSGTRADSVAVGLSTTVANVSDGLSAISDQEAEAIKEALQNAYEIGNNFESDYQQLWSSVIYQSAEYIIQNSLQFNSDLTALVNNNAHTFTETKSSTLFKWGEMLDWATYAKVTHGDRGTGTPNNSGNLDTEYEYYLQDTSTAISDTEMAVLLNFWTNISRDTTTRTAVLELVNSAFVKPNYFNTGAKASILRFVEEHSEEETAHVVDFANFDRIFKPFDSTPSVPYIANLDSSLSGLIYFDNLQRLSVWGPTTTINTVFSSSVSVSSVFERIADFNLNLEVLELQYVSIAEVSPLSINSIQSLTNLEWLDLSGNSGITAFGSVLNLDVTNIDFVDVSGVGIDNLVITPMLTQMFVLYQNANGEEPDLYYTLDSNRTRFILTSAEDSNYQTLLDCLFMLSDLNEISSAYVQLITDIYVGGSSYEIQWRVDAGNLMEEVRGAFIGEKVTSVAEMQSIIENVNSFLTVYYNGPTTGDFTNGRFYEIVYDDQTETFEYEQIAGRSATCITDETVLLDVIALLNTPLDVIYSGTSGVYTANTMYSLQYSNGTFEFVSQGTVSATNSADLAQILETANGVIEDNQQEFFSTASNYTSGGSNFNVTARTIQRIVYNENTASFVWEQLATVTQQNINNANTFTQNVGVYYQPTRARTLTVNGTRVSLQTANAYMYDGTTVHTFTPTSSVQTAITQANSYLNVLYRYTGTTNQTYTQNTYYLLDFDVSANAFAFSEVISVTTQAEMSTLLQNYQTAHDSYLGVYYLNDSDASTYLSGASYQLVYIDTSSSFEFEQVYPLATYVESVGDLNQVIDQVESVFDDVYYYTGATGNGYTRYGVYKVVYDLDSSSFVLEFVYATEVELNEEQTLDYILQNANQSVYGMYYFYTGSTVTSPVTGLTYENCHVYRVLMDENREFYLSNDENELAGIPTTGTQYTNLEDFMALPQNPENFGKLYQLAMAGDGSSLHTYASRGLYIMGIKQDTGALYLQTVGALSIEVSDDGSMRLVNERRYVRTDNDTSYAGTGGQQTAQVTAVISMVVDGETIIVERKFDLLVTD